jgi:ribonuclease HI
VQVDIPLCTEVIMEAGDTACGPDSIPFSVYKSLIDHTAPLLHDTYYYATNNNPCPPDTNNSLLYLIPKSNSDLVTDSRPISVGNVDVRLLGALTHKTIYNAIEKIISERQKGFMKNRNIVENIRTTNHKFHTARRNKKDYDTLFVDFKKAFDSLNHTFLFKLLQHVHLPLSTINAIRYLLTDLTSMTTFKGAPQAKIRLEKGVKQGCPLSPLLFVLVMEVLDDAIIRPPPSNINQTNPDIDSALYADDAKYSSFDLARHIPFLNRTFTLFGKATGLQINVAKSCIVKARPTSSSTLRIKEKLALSSWSELPIRPNTKWLGTIVGAHTSTNAIFADALKKFEQRTASYLPLKAQYSLPTRIRIANVFLISIFSYLYQIYFIPEKTLQKINRLLYKWIVPFNSVSLSDLTRPASILGLPDNLKDVRLMNVAALISNAPPSATPKKATKASLNGNDIAIHQNHALSYLCHTSAPLPANAPRSRIYNALINTGCNQLKNINRVISKLNRFGLEDSAKNIFNNCRAVHRKTPTFIRLTTFKAIHNALPSARRLRFLDSHIPPNTKCPFGCDEVDSAEHLFGSCEPVRQNYNSVRRLLRLPKITKDNWNFGTLLGANGLLDRKEATLNSFFTFVTWQARTDSLQQKLDLPYYFSANTSKLMTKYCPQLIQSAYGDTLPPLPDNHKLGSSGKRTKKQKQEAKKAAMKLIQSFPHKDIIAYTDGGTHITNPGPSGSGIHIPPSPNFPETDLQISLGIGTNNLGELAAIGYAISHIASRNPPRGIPIHILTDSYLAYGTLVFHWRSNTYPKLIRAIRKNIASVNLSNPISIHWIAGHSGIPGNEAADSNATAAANASDNTPVDITRITNDILSLQT